MATGDKKAIKEQEGPRPDDRQEVGYKNSEIMTPMGDSGDLRGDIKQRTYHTRGRSCAMSQRLFGDDSGIGGLGGRTIKSWIVVTVVQKKQNDGKRRAGSYITVRSGQWT